MPRTSSAALATQASRDLVVVFGRLRRVLREVGGDDDLSPSQASVLARLTKADDLSASDLAAAEGIRPQSVAAILGVLEERGLIERRIDPRDARRRVVALSGEGRNRAPRVREARLDWLAGELREHCTREELEAVVIAMAAVTRVVERP